MGLSTDYKMGGMINDTTRATLNTALDRDGRGNGILFQQHSMKEVPPYSTWAFMGKEDEKGVLWFCDLRCFSGGYTGIEAADRIFNKMSKFLALILRVINRL